MELFRLHYEKFLLMVALIILGATSFVLTRNSYLQPLPTLPPLWPLGSQAGIAIPKMTPVTVPAWESRIRLFGPTPVAEPKSDFCQWLESYEVVCNDSAAKEDPDGDGWTNELEYKFRTSPIDRSRFPLVSDVLVIERVVQPEFPLRFHGYVVDPNDEITFQLNLASDGSTRFVKQGETIRLPDGRRFMVEEFARSSSAVRDVSTDSMRTLDRSQLTLRSVADESRVALVLNERAFEPGKLVQLRNLLEDRSFIARDGDEITIGNKSYRFKLIESARLIATDADGREFAITSR